MKTKYKRTYHLPWSQGVQSDDKVIPSHVLEEFMGQEVVVSEKLDGENTSLYSDYMHARSIDSAHNFTRDWVKKMHSVLRHEFPEGWRFVGENMWAEHSIRYENLKGYFYLFAIFNEENVLIDYDEMVQYAEMLELPLPKVFGRFIYNEDKIKSLSKELDFNQVEGYVVRLKRAVYQDPEADFLRGIAKFVRKNHVQTDEHWLKNVKQNGELGEIVLPSFLSKN